MASTALRRKGGGGAPRSFERLIEMEVMDHRQQQPQQQQQRQSPNTGTSSSAAAAAVRNEFTGNILKIADTSLPPGTATATVKRRRCGTGPFDENWLNLDCCGLFCAMITYGLHLYGMYAVCLILLPPWMSTIDEEGYRHMTWMGQFVRLAFSTTAILAMTAHFKAMTTNPGAVPPDAIPLEESILYNNNNNRGAGGDGLGPDHELMTPLRSQPQPRGKKLCRRCKTFKPKRAHHCSVCGRCIIKMDRKWREHTGRLILLFVYVSYMFLSIGLSLSNSRSNSLVTSNLPPTNPPNTQIIVPGSTIVSELGITSISYSSCFIPSYHVFFPFRWL